MATLTVRIDDDLDRMLTELAQAQGRSKSELVRRMLRRQLAVTAFEETRRMLLPLGERAGYLTDEDVFRDIS